MTPKEKAFELAHKFRLLEIRTSENSYIMISMEDAKQCALIAVDEMLGFVAYDSHSKYLLEVKQEIEKL
jgi:flagellar assembly factor FliW